MARPVSSLESHPQRDKIIDSILAGRTLREIAAQADPPVSIAAISRFKTGVARHTAETIARAKVAIALKDNGIDANSAIAVTKAALTVASDPFLAAAEKQAQRRGRWMREIEEAGDYTDAGPDYGTLAKLDRNDQTGLELHARLAGRLDATPTAGSNTFVLVPIAVPMAQALPAAPAVDAEWCEVTEDNK